LLGSSNAGISAKASAAAVHGDSKQQATEQSRVTAFRLVRDSCSIHSAAANMRRACWQQLADID
jgi:hypothetical protein